MAIQRTRPCPFEQTAIDLGSQEESVAGTLLLLNNPPIAINDVFYVAYRTPITVDFLSNDIDPEGGELTVVSVRPLAEYGIIQNTGRQGEFLFTPNENISGSCIFEYIIRDNNNNESSGNITVYVSPPEPPPAPAPPPPLPPPPPRSELIPEPNTIFSNITDKYINNDEITLLDWPQNLTRVEYYVFKNNATKESDKLIGPILIVNSQRSFKVSFDVLSEDAKMLNNQIYIKARLFNSNTLIKTIFKRYKLINKSQASSSESLSPSPSELAGRDAARQRGASGVGGSSIGGGGNSRSPNDGRRRPGRG